MTPLVGVDIGTSATKALAVDRHGRVVGRAECCYGTRRPRPGFSEQDPEDWVRAASQALSEIGRVRPAGLAFTGQMHGLVLLDGHGQVLRPAILWNDGRAGAERRLIEARVGLRRLLDLVANRPMPGFTAPSLLWVRENERELSRKVSGYARRSKAHPSPRAHATKQPPPWGPVYTQTGRSALLWERPVCSHSCGRHRPQRTSTVDCKRCAPARPRCGRRWG